MRITIFDLEMSNLNSDYGIVLCGVLKLDYIVNHCVEDVLVLEEVYERIKRLIKYIR